MANIAGISQGVVYATQGNIGHPGSAADIADDNATAVAELNNHFGPGVTVTVAAATPAR